MPTARTELLRLLHECGAGKGIGPSEVARALDPQNWRARLDEVCHAAQRMVARLDGVDTEEEPARPRCVTSDPSATMCALSSLPLARIISTSGTDTLTQDSRISSYAAPAAD
jgi:hypothetical protein